MKWLIGILSLVFLIVFHELGHFFAAKLFGVKVESFSVGFGPVLLHKTINETDYRISLLPLGGYCGMKGEKDFQNALDNNLKTIECEKDSLYGVHPLKRAIIGFAGPFFNFIFAIIAYSFINFAGYSYYTYSNKVVIPENIEISQSPALAAGVRSGDIITQINNVKIIDFFDIVTEISIHPDEDITLSILRDNKNIEIKLHTLMNKEDGSGKIGIIADKNTLYLRKTDNYNIFQAFFKGISDAVKSIQITFKSIGILFKGVEVKNAVSGPARITDIIGTTAIQSFSTGFKQGLISLFDLMAIISISLFIMNLLPVPVLDGGLIVFAIIETISRKKINPKIQYYIQFAGIGFILILFFIGLTGDISYFINK